jgi:hypothetical protein
MTVLVSDVLTLKPQVTARILSMGLKNPNTTDENIFKPYNLGKQFPKKYRNWGSTRSGSLKWVFQYNLAT